MIYKHRGLYGIRIWRWFSFTITLWWSPKKIEALAKHQHPDQIIYSILLWFKGNPLLHKCSKCLLCFGLHQNLTKTVIANCFKIYKTNPGEYHWITNKTSGMLFLSCIKWLGDGKPKHPRDGFKNLT